MTKNYFLSSLFFLCTGISAFAQDTLWTRIAQPDSLQVNGVGFSANGTQIVSGTNCHPAHLRLWQTTTGSLMWDYEVPSSLMCLMGVGISANSNYIATIEEFGNIIIFDNTQFPPDSLTTITTGTTYAFSLAFSPNSMKIAAGGSAGKLKTYHTATGAIDLNVTAHTGYVFDVAYSPDGTKIATCAGDNKVKVWDTLGNLLHTFTNHTDDVLGVEFTPDNARLVSCSKDNTVKVFDVVNYTFLQSIAPSGSDVNAIAISPDGSYLATGSSDARVRLFNLNTYQLIQQLPYSSGNVLSLAWSPQGGKVVSGTGTGKVVLYDVSLIADVAVPQIRSFTVYPNPFAGLFQVITGNYEVSRITLSDATGRVVYENNTVYAANSVIDIAEQQISSGLYFLTLTTGSGERIVQRIIRQ
ncbi:MAG: T9SS type A sorting domain-containing protein [Bacteroidia bacterium]|jgi:WD40 repeat protein|nr:T9SS type A sorting domain-containing protein [Bacteroidia bacterium]